MDVLMVLSEPRVTALDPTVILGGVQGDARSVPFDIPTWQRHVCVQKGRNGRLLMTLTSDHFTARSCFSCSCHEQKIKA